MAAKIDWVDGNVVNAASLNTLGAEVNLKGTYTKPGTGIPTTDLADNSITNAKMADDSVGVAELSASGTPSSTTVLYGNNTWGTPAGGGGGASASHVQGVTVTTGSETRPTGSDIVMWVGGDTEPTNIGSADVWLAEGATTGTSSQAGIAFVPTEYFRLNEIDPAFAEIATLNRGCGNIFVAGRTAALSQLAVEVTTVGSAGSVLRMGLYELNGLNLTLKADFGTVSATTLGTKTVSGTALMTQGQRYFAVCVAQVGTTPPYLRQIADGVKWGTTYGFTYATGLFDTPFVSRVVGAISGALPSTGTIEASGEDMPCIVGMCSA